MAMKGQYLALGSILLLTHGADVAAKTKEAKQPNILFICIDDLRPDLGAYGHTNMVTPNLDDLASRGRLFTNHYVQVPTSGASRAALLTGRFPREKGHTNNFYLTRALLGSEEQEHPETFIHHIRRNGYYTVGMGKVSHSADGMAHLQKESLGVADLPYSWDKYVTDPDSPWPKGDGLLHAYADGRSRYDEGVDHPAIETLDLPDESYPDGVLANMAVAELEQLAECDKPFFMAVGFYKPHLPFSAPKKYWDMYDSEDVPLSPNREAPEGVEDVFLHNSGEFNYQYSYVERAAAGKVMSDENSRNLRHAYFAAISYTDAQVGKVIAKLRELELDKNTIIIVWGDHGWHLGDHTIWGKHSTFERALNSAFMIVTPDMKRAGVASNELVASVDIYPTICELTGIERPKGIDGTSIVPILKKPNREIRTEVMSYWNDKVSLRTDRYRMALHDDGKRRYVMLFDHDVDPNETKNIASDNTLIVTELTRKIERLCNGYFDNAK